MKDITTTTPSAKAALGIILCLFLLPVLLTPASAGEADEDYRLVYRETMGEAVSEKRYTIQFTGAGYHIEIQEGLKLRELRTSPDLATRHEVYRHAERPDRVEAKRQGDVLVFQGTLNGEDIRETKQLGDEIWFGSVLLLRNFVLGDKDEIQFYVTKPEETKAVKLKAIREGVETVDVDGKAVRAIKIKYTVPDIRGMFWKSYYWYRESDGLLIKTSETRGPPGTPKAAVELVEEKGPGEDIWRTGTSLSASAD